MPVSIPTYLATQFVKNTNLTTRMKTLRYSYKFQYISILTIGILNIPQSEDVLKESIFASTYL
jgi:hypothetical protein